MAKEALCPFDVILVTSTSVLLSKLNRGIVKRWREQQSWMAWPWTVPFGVIHHRSLLSPSGLNRFGKCAASCADAATATSRAFAGNRPHGSRLAVTSRHAHATRALFRSCGTRCAVIGRFPSVAVILGRHPQPATNTGVKQARAHFS